VSDLIIRASANRHPAVRMLDGILTVGLWTGYFYLMKDVFSVTLSYFGVSAPWGLQFDDIAAISLRKSLQSYAFVIIINATVFISWALYNQIRFGSRNRRRRSDRVSAAETGEFFDLTADQVDACRAAQRMVMVHDKAGALIGCDVLNMRS